MGDHSLSQRPPRHLTPLWVIALFLTLTETVLGVAATQTSGGVQITLTAFVVTFPVGVAGAFFWILATKPQVFYAPLDYGPEVDVLSFVQAVSGSYVPSEEADLYGEIRRVLNDVLTSPDLVSELTTSVHGEPSADANQKIRALLSGAADKASRDILEHGFLVVDVSELLGSSKKVQLPYGETQSVSDFLDQLWLRLNEDINLPPFSYGRIWTLEIADSGRNFGPMGSQWAKANNQMRDFRPLKLAGLDAGMQLKAVWLRRRKA